MQGAPAGAAGARQARLSLPLAYLSLISRYSLSNASSNPGFRSAVSAARQRVQMNLSRIIEDWAGATPQRCAIHFHGEDVTYAELWRRIEVATAVLAEGFAVKPGERIGWLDCESLSQHCHGNLNPPP